MRSHFFRTSLVTLAAGTALFAGPWRPGTATGDENADPALNRALDSISTASIHDDIFTLASDAMGGRNTPSDGQRMAAQYIVSRLKEYGIPPGAKDGEYLFPYELEHRGLIAEECSAVVTAGKKVTKLELGKQYFFHPDPFSMEDVDVSGTLAYVGTSDPRRNDFEGLNLKGHWALLTYEAVEGENAPDPRREMDNLQKRAVAQGAVGIVLLPGEGFDQEALEQRMLGSIEVSKAGRVNWPGQQQRFGRRGGQTEPRLPIVLLSNQGAIALKEAIPNKKLKRGLELGADFHEVRKFTPEGHRTTVHDICAFWEGSDPKLKSEVLIVSAHYDHVGYLADGRVNNGADDNGSGTTGLVNLAKALAAHGPMRRSVMLIWVSGEEKGLLGSRAWVENPWLPDGCKPVANINIDMIGRNAPDYLMITPTKTGRYADQYNGLVRRAEKFCAEEGFPQLASADEYYERSDQANFHKLGIPVCFLFDDIHEDYHKPTDDPEKIDTDKIRRVVRLVMRILGDLQEDDLGV